MVREREQSQAKKETQEPSHSPTPPTATTSEGASQTEAPSKPTRPLPVSDFLMLTSSTLVTKAWAYLGLVSHTETGQIHKDLKQAELAIDALDQILTLLKAAGQNVQEFEFQLTNLRINYVSQKKKSS